MVSELVVALCSTAYIHVAAVTGCGSVERAHKCTVALRFDAAIGIDHSSSTIYEHHEFADQTCGQCA
jgi:hypothetical protein